MRRTTQDEIDCASTPFRRCFTFFATYSTVKNIEKKRKKRSNEKVSTLEYTMFQQAVFKPIHLKYNY